jgi:hypothetical protein
MNPERLLRTGILVLFTNMGRKLGATERGGGAARQKNGRVERSRFLRNKRGKQSIRTHISFPRLRKIAGAIHQNVVLDKAVSIIPSLLNFANKNGSFRILEKDVIAKPKKSRGFASLLLPASFWQVRCTSNLESTFE